MDEVFRDLEKAGKNDVENLIKWMKDSKVIETAKEERTRQLFKDTVCEQKVELEKFKEVLVELATEQSKTLEQITKQLAAQAPKFIDAALVGLQAFKEALEADK